LAIKPVDNETFYREVDEELRREQLTGTWKRYGKWIVAAVLLFLAALAGFLYWQQQKELRAGEHGEQLTALFEDIQAGKTKGAEGKLDALANESGPGYRAAALLTKADLAVTQGNEAAALATFRQVAEDDDVAAPWRELALIRQTAIEFDKIPPATVIQRLQPLAQAGNPWFGSAGEMVAVAHLKQQRPQQAAGIFAAMAKDENIPESIRSRALQMAGALGVDAVQQADGKAGATKEATQ
jgi:hypothetical protein